MRGRRNVSKSHNHIAVLVFPTKYKPFNCKLRNNSLLSKCVRLPSAAESQHSVGATCSSQQLNSHQTLQYSRKLPQLKQKDKCVCVDSDMKIRHFINRPNQLSWMRSNHKNENIAFLQMPHFLCYQGSNSVHFIPKQNHSNQQNEAYATVQNIVKCHLWNAACSDWSKYRSCACQLAWFMKIRFMYWWSPNNREEKCKIPTN